MAAIIRTIITGVGVNDIIDILLTAFIIYKVIEFMQQTRAQQLIKGILIVIAAYMISDYFSLHTINWILRGLFTIGLFAIVVLFQPELRRGLEVMGRMKLSSTVGNVDEEKRQQIIQQLIDAVMTFSKTRTGALIVFERETALEDIAETGTILEADISAQLLGNLFYVGSPLHDGAVIIKKDQVYAAGCVLPLTKDKYLSKSLGTRHRAGIGITENSDCLTIIVSEETGIISVAEGGRIRRHYNEDTLRGVLDTLYTDNRDKKHRIWPIHTGMDEHHRYNAGSAGEEEDDEQ